MRRLIIILMSLTMFLTTVKADEYGIWTELDENMEKDAITEKRYRFYKEEKVGKYLENFDELESNFQYKDLNNIKYLEYSNWQKECDVDANIYNIETKTLNAYQRVIDTRFIILNNFSKDSSINKINIYTNNQLINYKILSCVNCTNNLEKIGKNNIVKLVLDDFIKIDNIKLEIEFDDLNTDYQITFSNDANSNKISLRKEVNSKNIEFIMDNTWLNNHTYSDVFYEIESLEENDFIKYLGQVEMCRYQKYLIYNYNLEKVYYDNNYYNDVFGYVKDNNDYKIYYKNKINTSPVTMSFEKNIEEVDENIIEKDAEDSNNTININEKEKNTKKNINNKIDNRTDTELVKTLSISNNKSIIKYIILIVIGLTLIYIIYSNRKIIIKK